MLAEAPRGLTAAVGVREGYNSNVNTLSSGGDGSFFTELDFDLLYKFGGSRLELEAGFGGNVGYYYSMGPQDNWFPNLEFNLASSYKLSPRTTLTLEGAAGWMSQPGFNSPGSYSSQGSYFLGNLGGGIEHRWMPKLSTVTAWTANVYEYETREYQESLGRIEQIGSNQLVFLWKPATALVQEYRFNPRIYFSDSDMNSVGQYFLFGANHRLNPRSSVSGRFGLEQRWLNEPDGGSGGYLGPYGEIKAQYAAGKTTADLLTSYGTQSSGLVGVGESDTFQVNLSVGRQLGSRTKLTLFTSYQNNNFDQQQQIPSFTDNVLDVGGGIAHKLSRSVSFELGYRYSTVVSTSDAERGYQRSIAFVGTRIEF